jgi:hypothetical protein
LYLPCKRTTIPIKWQAEWNEEPSGQDPEEENLFSSSQEYNNPNLGRPTCSLIISIVPGVNILHSAFYY